jgi:hypothetical protein
MAKRSSESASGNDKAKVRVFFAEVEGNNESIQEALKTMVSAMSRPVRVISEQKLNGSPALLSQNETEETEESTPELEETEVVEQETSARKSRGVGKRDRNAGLALVPDLDFRPNNQQSLKEFVDAKNPTNDVETTLVAVYYMQHVMKLPKIGAAHVMTAFKEAGKAVPVDLRQTIRNVKNTRMWVNFTDLEEIRTTTQGDNEVEHEMGNGTTS